MSQITPEQYMCYRAKEALTIDGHLTEASWKRASRPPLFVDIEGNKKPLPLKNSPGKICASGPVILTIKEILQTSPLP